MGARVTRNVASTQGSEISGKTYRLLSSIEVRENMGFHFEYEKYHSSSPDIIQYHCDIKEGECIFSPGDTLTITSVFRGYNFPDVGNIRNVVATIGNYKSVLVNSLFEGCKPLEIMNDKDAKFKPINTYLEEVDMDRIEVDSVTIPIPHKTRKQLIGAIVITYFCKHGMDVLKDNHSLSVQYRNTLNEMSIQDLQRFTQSIYEYMDNLNAQLPSSHDVQNWRFESDIAEHQ